MEDPLDNRILRTLDKLCVISKDSRRDLVNKYIHWVKICGDDIPQIIDELKKACHEGIHIIHHMVKIAIISYPAALTKNTKATLTDISVLVTDVAHIAQEAMRQKRDLDISIEHLAGSGSAVTIAWGISSLNSTSAHLLSTTFHL